MSDTDEIVGSVRERLVASLRVEIADGQLLPGAKLNERDICERFGVSRTAVREAYRQLEAEGFIELLPNRGAIVAKLSYTRAVHLFELRSVLEALACELCAIRANEEQKRQLWCSVENVERAMLDGNVSSMIAAKDLYYNALLNGASNPELREALTRLHVRISQLRRVSLGSSGRSVHSLSEIRDIRDAIIAGDGSAAWIAGQNHVRCARAATLPALFESKD